VCSAPPQQASLAYRARLTRPVASLASVGLGRGIKVKQRFGHHQARPKERGRPTKLNALVIRRVEWPARHRGVKGVTRTTFQQLRAWLTVHFMVPDTRLLKGLGDQRVNFT